MMPPDHIVEHAIQVARMSPCRSKRGVVIWDPATGSFRGHGFNAPPALLACPGRELCAGTCGQRTVHAEVRAIYAAALARVPNLETSPVNSELLHVELAPVTLERFTVAGGTAGFHVHHGIVACDGPSCGSCAALIADVGFIAGVWLFEQREAGWAQWQRYSAEEFYEATMHRVRPPATSVPGAGRHLHE